MNPSRMIGSLAHVKYHDHVLCRNVDSRLFEPATRECVGWIIKENEKAVWIVLDRSIEPRSTETEPIEESSLIILRHEILEITKIE